MGFGLLLTLWMPCPLQMASPSISKESLIQAFPPLQDLPEEKCSSIVDVFKSNDVYSIAMAQALPYAALLDMGFSKGIAGIISNGFMCCAVMCGVLSGSLCCLTSSSALFLLSVLMLIWKCV